MFTSTACPVVVLEASRCSRDEDDGGKNEAAQMRQSKGWVTDCTSKVDKAWGPLMDAACLECLECLVLLLLEVKENTTDV